MTKTNSTTKAHLSLEPDQLEELRRRDRSAQPQRDPMKAIANLIGPRTTEEPRDRPQFKFIDLGDKFYLDHGYVRVQSCESRTGWSWELPAPDYYKMALDHERRYRKYAFPENSKLPKFPGTVPNVTQTIYGLARKTIEDKQQWSAGETVVLWQGRRLTAYVSEYGTDGGGLLYLGMRNGNPDQTVRVQCGHLNPLTAWRFTLTRTEYHTWVEQASRL